VASSQHSRVRCLLSLNRPCYSRLGMIKCFYSLDAEWICAKKDWQKVQKRAKERRSSVSVPQEHTADHPELRDPVLNDVVSEPPVEPKDEAGHHSSSSKETSRDSAAYQPEMDEMRCILYAHGGTVWLPSSQDDGRIKVVCTRRLLLWQCRPGTVSSFRRCNRCTKT
jgi:hypothetical protein